MAIKVGTNVRQLVPAPIAGVVTERRIRPGDDEIECLVVWTDAEGHEQARWFLETEIEVL